MICPHCKSLRTVKKGSGRALCLAEGHPADKPRSFNAISAAQADEISVVRHGIAPEHGLNVPMPAGYLMGKVTVQQAGGNVERTWTRMSPDAEMQQAAMEAAIAAMAERLPRERPVPAPRRTRADLCNLYVLTDYHLGMLAWGEETGEDWDLQIAEDLMVRWFSAAIAQSPAADVGVFAQLGDFLHWDGMDAVTPTSRHLLDADTRFQKLVRVAIRVVRRVIGMLLGKHKRVHIIMAEGNHDIASSIWMREWLATIYENEPRVTVDRNPDPYYCYEHGYAALLFHHGHKHRMKNIDTVFVAKYREVFGRTKLAHAHMGHLHHIDIKETNLMTVEQHRTLAPSDSHASRGGWMSDREAQVITYSAKSGREVGRLKISPDMLDQAEAA